MPELPEAESIARALNRTLKNQKIVKVEVFSPKLRTSLKPLVKAGLEGRTFLGCRRRSRYALADMDDNRTLVMHFGMSGVVCVESARALRRKHEHVFIHLADGRAVRFEDPRRFGFMEVHTVGRNGWPKMMDKLGVEPLGDDFTGEYLHAAALKRKKSVKELLMDNAIVTGIGNIYAAETLFAAGVSPLRKSASLDRCECDRIVRAARRILREAIKWGGTTVSDFKNVDGSEGKFVQKLKIYSKTKCPKCKGEVSKAVQGGRTSWFCAACQK